MKRRNGSVCSTPEENAEEEDSYDPSDINKKHCTTNSSSIWLHLPTDKKIKVCNIKAKEHSVPGKSRMVTYRHDEMFTKMPRLSALWKVSF